MRILKIALTINLILFFTGTVSAKIVFSAYKDGVTNIYVMDDDGSDIRQITDYPHAEVNPRWSADGKQIAFLRDTNPSSRVYYNTFIMNADGTHVRQLTNHQGNDRRLAFSPDGKQLVVSILSGRSMLGLHVIDIESGDIQRISRHEIRGVDWSPDGREIVFANDDISLTEENIWIMNTDGMNARPLLPPITRKRTMDRGEPRWSPDGRQILYVESDTKVEIKEHANGSKSFSITGAGTFRYRIHNLNDRGTQTLEIPNNWMPYSVAWMRGQKSVLFCAFVDYDRRFDSNYWSQVYKYNIISKTITQLTHDRGNKRGADWVSDDVSSVTAVSPSGKQALRWGALKKSYAVPQ